MAYPDISTGNPSYPDMTGLKLYLASTNSYPAPAPAPPPAGTPGFVNRGPGPAQPYGPAPTPPLLGFVNRGPGTAMPYGPTPASQPFTAPPWVSKMFGSSPPTAALAAASAAAAKAAPPDTSYDVGNQGRPPQFNGSAGAPESATSNAAWNTHVDEVSKQLANLGVTNATAVLGQTPPTWDKGAGEAAINAGGGPRLLNYGYGSTIVGQSTNGSRKLNDFRGVGSGAAPAGAAGVYGAPPPGSQSPYDQVASHLQDIMNQAGTLRARGDLAGAMQARGLENHAARMASIFSTVAQHAHNMGALGVAQGQLGVARGELALRTAQGYPAYERAVNENQLLADGRYAPVGAINRVLKGGGAAAPIQPLQPMSYGRDEDTGERTYYDLPTMKR